MMIQKNLLILFAFQLCMACQPSASTTHTTSIPAQSIETGKKDDSSVRVKMLYSSQQCSSNDSKPAASWVNDKQALQKIMRRVRSSQLGGTDINYHALNFDNEIAVLVEMGRKPSLGYSFKLADRKNLEISHDRAYISLEWMPPDSKKQIAQVISSPCLLLKLDRGNYSTVKIIDSNGNSKASATMKTVSEAVY